MNILENLKKPWVIYAGLGIGLVLLVTRSSGGSSQSTNVKAVADYQQSMNIAGMNYMQHIYDQSIAFSMAQTSADVNLKALVASAIVSMNETSSIQQTQRAVASDGITNSVIAASTALRLDRQQNASRTLLYSLVAPSTLDNLNGQVMPQLAEQNANQTDVRRRA